MTNSDSKQIAPPAAAGATPLAGDPIDSSPMANSSNIGDSTNTETAALPSDTDTHMTDLPPTAPEGSSASQTPTATTTAATRTTLTNYAGEDEELLPILFDANGDFELLLPATEQWGHLYLRTDQVGGKLWGRFKIGNMDGAIRADDIQGLEYGDRAPFIWRYIDKEAGVIKFGPTRTGSLQGVNWTFDERGGITGEFLGLVADGQTLEFEGVYTGDNCPRFAELASYWRNIAQRAFLQG